MAYAAAEPSLSIIPGIGYLFEESTGTGNESDILRRLDKESFEHFSTTYLRSWGNPFIRFLRLKSEWEIATAHLSSVTEMSMHPTYQQIIGMGPVAIPFILAELRNRPGHWFWALKAITGDDPVLPGHRGRIKQMAQDWLEWGKKQGYL
jgi:hypothetical protein